MATASHPHPVPEALIRKIGALPRERLAEIEDFVDFLSERERSASADRAIRGAAMQASAPAFAAVWSNPEDDIYDAL